MDARPEILNHNVETVPRLFKQVQPQDNYEWAAATLSNAKKLDPEVLTKSGIMVGLGEDMDEVKAVMRDQRSWGVDILTIGQYLQPSKKHLPIARYYTMEEFAELRDYGREIGFKWVEIAPAGALLLPRRRPGARAERGASQVVPIIIIRSPKKGWAWGAYAPHAHPFFRILLKITVYALRLPTPMLPQTPLPSSPN